MIAGRLLRLAVATGMLAAASCGGENPIARWAPKRAPHEAYAESLRSAGLDAHALGQAWLAASGASLGSPQAVTLPFHETGYLDPAKPSAIAYRVDLSRGRALEIAAFNGFALVDAGGRRGWVRGDT